MAWARAHVGRWKRESVGGKACWCKEADELTETPKDLFVVVWVFLSDCRYRTLIAIIAIAIIAIAVVASNG